MKIVNRSLLRPTTGSLNKYAVSDKKYMISAITVTTNKFAPSGSLNMKNNTFEHAIAVMPKMSNEVFFDLKYIFVIIY